jgi:CBS domain-containing protein
MQAEQATVREIMVTEVRTVYPETPVVWAAQIMTKHHIRHLVVIDNLARIQGVITERHILKHFSPWLTKGNSTTEPAAPPPSIRVADVMTQSPITVTADTPIPKAAEILASKKIGCLPVESSGQVVGIITAVDVLRYIAASGTPGRQEEFETYIPPAFLNKDREITLPGAYFPGTKLQDGLHAVLSYARKTKRIGVKLFSTAEQGGEVLGCRPVRATDKYVTIPAGDFLDYHNLNVRGPLEVEQTGEPGYVILSPVLSPTFHALG